MFRLLLTRRWLTALLVATLFFVACLFLGRWQYGRHLEKKTHAHQVETYYSAPPVPLDQVLPAGTRQFPADQEWRRVQVTGRYEPDGRFMVRNRPQKVTYGYEVMETLRPTSGDAILVDRGWVRNGERADLLPAVPAAPTGEVTVTGWLRPGEESLEGEPPAGQLASIDLSRARTRLGQPIRPAYLILDGERTPDGATPDRPQPLIPPSTDLGPHFAYSLQWWGGSVVGFVLVFVYLRREYEDSLADTDPRRAPRQPRPRKTRIWDEEDG